MTDSSVLPVTPAAPVDVDTFRQQAKEWVEANLTPRGSAPPATVEPAGQPDLKGMDVERALQRRLFEGGFAGITYPAIYGGRGLSRAHESAFHDVAAGYRLPELGILGGTTFAVCGPTMLEHASPEFLHRHIPRMLAGDELWAQFFSEPDAGSDLAGIRTRAVRDGDDWVVSGAKVWSSGALEADFGLCLARTNWEVSKHRGLTWLAIPTNARGVSVQPIVQINGGSEFAQEFLDEVRVPDTERIGNVDAGWAVAQSVLLFERGWGSERTGPPKARALAPDLVALARSADRLQDPVARQKIAQAQINEYAVGQLGQRLVSMMRAGLNPGVAAYAKLAAGTFDPARARLAVEIGGAAALLWEQPGTPSAAASLAYLDSRKMAIAGGTNEVQRNGIGERVLGLPREPSFDTNKPFNDVLRDAQNWTGQAPR